ncbi:hypothetical protein DDZ18_00710 [Marinicauda salina]|uniref:Invasion associated locus B family protein n=1 Tax=Marinicauda salina TaxID=2135793 RepID=A0A2U2BVZ9_9PROT|nr:invasion associated locus B family protein [Marinicauda salina]PWE18167.1 hypothetical protein DDZ18_00710 [Marinicauda salina]
MIRTILALIAVSAAGAATAAAQEPEFQGAHRDWRVFTRAAGDDLICYALSRPQDSRPGNVDHGDVYFIVATWASGAAEEQPSFLAGYTLRPDSPPRVRVGSDSFRMYVSEQEGFIESGRDEERLVSAMRRGADMRVEATSARGTATAYEFSLMGITAALQDVEDLCG